ncbi:response regulator transcription factor [Hydrogenophaga sp. OTU3427]|uniref:response regulator transcription factor n=1 Tax=Hydrogenophaga sp. OTU3427 TaxID=3043856 RepID=UPI00313AF312
MAVQDILVVDDSRTELLFLSDLLGRHGYTVRTAENAEEAFRQIGEALPDLILLDVVMPGQNGFQFTRQLTRHPQYGKVPVFLCTSKSQETDRVWGLRQGARDYITKPVNPSQLLAKIAAVDQPDTTF